MTSDDASIAIHAGGRCVDLACRIDENGWVILIDEIPDSLGTAIRIARCCLQLVRWSGSHGCLKPVLEARRQRRSVCDDHQPNQAVTVQRVEASDRQSVLSRNDEKLKAAKNRRKRQQ